MAEYKKSCSKCRHIEWVDGDTEATTGWSCNKRQDAILNSSPNWPAIEASFLLKLEDEKYRNRYKRCFEQGGNSD